MNTADRFRHSLCKARRHFIGSTARALCAVMLGSRLTLSGASAANTAKPTPRYRIAVCDWMILKRQKIGAFQLAKELGADGVEVDMGSLGDRATFENRLSEPDVRGQFLDKARDLDLSIPSLAMSGFYAQSFAHRDGVEKMVQDCIETAKTMGVKTAFLPLGVHCDLVKPPELRPLIIERLKAIAPKAENAEVIIGIETTLNAAEEVKLLDAVGSHAIQSYFNFANSLPNHRDLLAELRLLGRERICQIHCTDEDGVLLAKNPRLDLLQVKETLDDMGWSGWLVVERSRDAKNPRDVNYNFGANVRYLRTVFQRT